MAARLPMTPGESPAEYQFLQTDIVQNSNYQRITDPGKYQDHL